MPTGIYKRTKKQKLMLSKARIGKKHSIETRKKMSQSQIGKHAGNKCHFWKGGISSENHRIRESLEYKLWRKQVFERDNYTCQHCGDRGGWSKNKKKRIVLNADHIKQFALYPELRFNIDNGKTLCVSCHRKTDTWGVNVGYMISEKEKITKQQEMQGGDEVWQ